MKILILLPLLVTAEWVEITQNYRKEYKPTRHDTSSKNIYNNHSIVEHPWNKGHVYRINNPSVKRIQTIERKTAVDLNRFHDDFIPAEKPQRTEFKDQECYHESNQASKMDQDIENVSRNKHEGFIKALETDTINSKTTLDTNEKHNKKIENTIEEKQNGIKNESVGKNNENLCESETTPCQNFNINLEREEVKSTLNKQKQTAGHEDKIKTKSNAMESLIKFLKIVSQTIKHGTRRTFKSKIRYLEDLRETLLANIEARIDSAFPDDTDQRRRRATVEESRGHVEFPSSESALMTISFLTFAVFLIKLVLQVIHTYKAKTMMVTPAVVATVGRAVFKKSTHN